MTAKQARYLGVGTAVLYDGLARGVVTANSFEVVTIQWADLSQAWPIPHNQCEKIEIEIPKPKGRYDR